MDLAMVRGQCTATVKEPSLAGHRLALVQRVSPDGVAEGGIEVALDVTSAAPGQLVVLARGSAARLPAQTRQLATDLTVVAIVDEVTLASPDRHTRSRTRKTSTTSTKVGKS